MKCFHHNDADGRCAAAIVAMAAPECRPEKFYEMDYAKTPDFSEIRPDETVYIVDLSFKPDQMERLQRLTANIIWIDHHKSCAEYPYAKIDLIAGLRDFDDKGRSGCELTWMYLMKKEIPYGVALIGDYDAWRLQLPNVMEFRAGIEIEDQHPLSPMWPDLFHNLGKATEIIQNGKTCIRYRDQYCADMMKQFGFETELDGIQAYACNVFRFGSPGFGPTFKAYPMCIAFAFDGSRFTVSLYSERKDIDCAAVAKKFGGGGHHGAAGFVCKELPFKA